MSSRNQTLMLFTMSFPYGKSEQFLETEILFLADRFKHVLIVPSLVMDNKRVLPPNSEVINPAQKFKPALKIRRYIFKHLFKILFILFYTLVKTRDKTIYLSKFKNRIVNLSLDIEKSEYYYNHLKKHLETTDLIYFYWFVEPAFHFCILKKQNRLSQKMITRAHGYDYDHLQGKIAYYREFELSQLDFVLPVSSYGKTYFKNNYPNVKSQVQTSYLGVKEKGNNELRSNKEFRIVSCSAFHPVKRVHKIIEVLALLKENVTWTHFGTGDLEMDIKSKALNLPSNIKVEFKGQVDNRIIIDFYLSQQVDIFINVSELEGIPVSIMEAISFGIPSIGCNTCGVPEIITPSTGFLFDKEFDPAEMAKVISIHLNKSKEQKKEFAKSVKAFWHENFRADKNYKNFIDTYLS